MQHCAKANKQNKKESESLKNGRKSVLKLVCIEKKISVLPDSVQNRAVFKYYTEPLIFSIRYLLLKENTKTFLSLADDTTITREEN